MLVLRSMEAARKARSRIHATIVGSGVGQDGRTTGLSLPSAESPPAFTPRSMPLLPSWKGNPPACRLSLPISPPASTGPSP